MNLCTPALLSAAVIALLAGCNSTSVSPAHPTTRGATPVAARDLPNGPEAGLEKGMIADTVRKIMGAPNEITPMPAPTGQAEVWIYRRTVSGAVRQVQVGSRSIPIQTVRDTDGTERVVQSIEEPILRQEFELIDMTIRLLMYDHAYVEQTRSAVRRVSYQ